MGKIILTDMISMKNKSSHFSSDIRESKWNPEMNIQFCQANHVFSANPRQSADFFVEYITWKAIKNVITKHSYLLHRKNKEILFLTNMTYF